MTQRSLLDYSAYTRRAVEGSRAALAQLELVIGRVDADTVQLGQGSFVLGEVDGVELNFVYNEAGRVAQTAAFLAQALKGAGARERALPEGLPSTVREGTVDREWLSKLLGGLPADLEADVYTQLERPVLLNLDRNGYGERWGLMPPVLEGDRTLMYVLHRDFARDHLVASWHVLDLTDALQRG